MCSCCPVLLAETILIQKGTLPPYGEQVLGPSSANDAPILAVILLLLPTTRPSRTVASRTVGSTLLASRMSTKRTRDNGSSDVRSIGVKNQRHGHHLHITEL